MDSRNKRESSVDISSNSIFASPKANGHSQKILEQPPSLSNFEFGHTKLSALETSSVKDFQRPTTAGSFAFPAFSTDSISLGRASENGEVRRAGTPVSMLDSPATVSAAFLKRSDPPEGSTGPRKRSVQFTRPTVTSEDSLQTAASNKRKTLDPWEQSSQGQSFVSKFKAFTGIASSARTSSISAVARNDQTTSDDITNLSMHDGAHSTDLQDEESDADADTEESTRDESPHSAPQKKRRSVRPRFRSIQTAPNSPKWSPARPHPSFAPSDFRVPHFLHRRAATTDMVAEDEPRGGISEDEGRSRLNRESAWRRSRAWMHNARGLSYSIAGQHEEQDTSGSRRPSNFRRLTAFGNFSDTPDLLMSPWRRVRGERPSSLSGQKWRQIQAKIRGLGQRKKVENTIDHKKSAELVAELLSGAPAAILFASMFQRDERGNQRMPVLLEQLRISIKTNYQAEGNADKHPYFRIELQYGNGPTQMKWEVRRTVADFAKLHAKYKLARSTQKYIQLKDKESQAKLPRFPRSAVMRSLRSYGVLESDSEDEENQDEAVMSGAEGSPSITEMHEKGKKRFSLTPSQRKSSVAVPADGNATGGSFATTGHIASIIGGSTAVKKEPYPDHQRKKLELYLQQLLRCMMFRPESNRLCRFLELSTLGVHLATEGSYHGKEGFLKLESIKGTDYRKTPNVNITGNRWFLVRHSYIVWVDSPLKTDICDVFLVDADFNIRAKHGAKLESKQEGKAKQAKELAQAAKDSAPTQHVLKLQNSERKIRLLARNEHHLEQFESSIKFMVDQSPWSRPKRFDSFAPVRQNVFARWLVDGRDYFWLVSRAIDQAKEAVYIHDWWLSPELYLRRPPAISHKWRLDRLLKRKAEEGVKIFIVMYRNVQSAVPIDSEYSKLALLDLHPNIFVQRSPNQFRQGQFFWAHHEKLCLVDHSVAFIGGVDLCFGRWDTPEHSVVDDKLTGLEDADSPKDADHCQLWPGKDYSNPRVQDFYGLEKPFEEMYDRTKIPRMPWHDVHMQVVGQPARDLTRHFVQRWNFILRQRKPSRPTPLLLPPPDFDPTELEELGLLGTCEVQMLRSCTDWSMGTPNKTECSILNAYVKLIEDSEHLVYIENQFFISTSEWDTIRIQNGIASALVERIIRAAENDEDWRAIIIIPLIPGFQNTVDSQDGTSVRLIMQCQFRTICRGENSIFGRLRSAGIDPEEYIQFYSLRAWGKIGPQKQIVTEQLYIHAKIMIVDDRRAIIGSANINERSQLGSRDSECAALVDDKDMLPSTMAGEPYMVGRFAHSLRMRLMREHLGLDVDAISEAERQKQSAEADAPEDWGSLSDVNFDLESPNTQVHEFRDDAGTFGPGLGTPATVSEGMFDRLNSRNPLPRSPLSTSSPIRSPETKSSKAEDLGNVNLPPPPKLPRLTSHQLGLPLLSQLPPLPNTDDTDIGGPTTSNMFMPGPTNVFHPLITGMKRPYIEEDCMKDPLNDSFIQDVWNTVAENNTKLYRIVFRCQPDNEVKNWVEYREYTAYAERFAEAQGGGKTSKPHLEHESTGRTGPPGTGSVISAAEQVRQSTAVSEQLSATTDNVTRPETSAEEKAKPEELQHVTFPVEHSSPRQTPESVDANTPPRGNVNKTENEGDKLQRTASQQPRRRRRATTRGSRKRFSGATEELLSIQDAEALANMIQGHLVIWPYEWLEKEEQGGNWLYSIDTLAPIEIYD